MKRNIMPAVLLVGLGLPLQGCVVWEIRDELRSANAQLGEVHESLKELEKTNQLIAEVEVGLGKIDTTNASLGDVDKRLMLLQQIEMSLGRLDVHLASLRKTIGKIDHAIPFLGLGGDEAMPPELAQGVGKVGVEIGAEPVKEGVKEGAKEGEAAKGGAKEGAKEPAVAKEPVKARDPMMGTWVQRFPEQPMALVLLTDGRYIRVVQGGKPATQRGTWAREGAGEYVFTPEAAPPGQKGEPGAAQAWRLTVVSVSVRAATVMDGEQVVVLARP
jgi:hypothetical protein